ncbi:50S ribosomal protein L13 [Candidatus Woesebacteria bacterium RIFOXYB1_FULL_38_16]|uniref:Large ribosomal subunit protein uL13 n=1 Tax=Candidatus Woesebacteria bacterium RIFOXYB1_FULL_38_16 TaxID=1802538 RepID=A0A1F8CVG8_9BACT|nr:MAG: 50S ribosomal protein L13 [Candidatus Woesebacteria bacterium RIFOXYA1_FULL_38_9]OGM80066.1 MAG: 50S ribosomal protein L13 [Candidatus Woesebacteria bacterium RIFOXYB1_FULL_38_16]
MKTYQPKGDEMKHDWHLIDAKDYVLGRMATKVVGFLMGKQKPSYATQADLGDWVVVLNAKKVKVTGKKEKQKVYFKHSGYPGGFKEVAFDKLRREKPERIVELAVKRMLPKNRLQAVRMNRLKIVSGENNPYQDKFSKKGGMSE